VVWLLEPLGELSQRDWVEPAVADNGLSMLKIMSFWWQILPCFLIRNRAA